MLKNILDKIIVLFLYNYIPIKVYVIIFSRILLVTYLLIKAEIWMKRIEK